jgi:hypothetical protein
MMSTRIPSLNDTYFQHKVLTKVHGGQPTTKRSRRSPRNSKQMLVPCPPPLEADNMAISAYSYRQPAMPLRPTLYHGYSQRTLDPLSQHQLEARGTAAQIEAAQDVWRELKHSFELCQATEKALVAQIVDARCNRSDLPALPTEPCYWPVCDQHPCRRSPPIHHTRYDHAPTS